MAHSRKLLVFGTLFTSNIRNSPNSGGLPIRQNRQLPKAGHGVGARPVQRKARKMFY